MAQFTKCVSFLVFGLLLMAIINFWTWICDFVRIIHLLVFDASFLKFMLVETWILIVVNCFANREYFDFLGRIAKICL